MQPLCGMKEDAMGNGQLKPVFNLQHGVDSEYIVWLTVGPQPTDTQFLDCVKVRLFYEKNYRFNRHSAII